ncbi:MAG: acetoin utilization protein AcuC, partial [Ignavibacteriae bacterium]|nr:acetoin utilization protein AcuC [Ignavibacteriota bacterium]
MCRVIYHPKYDLYNLGESHPFSPQRVQMVIELLKEWNLYSEPLLPTPIESEKLKEIHSEEYVD